MRPRVLGRLAAAALVAPLVVSCAFVLNFDELQEGKPGASDGGGSGGSGGTGGSSGSAGTGGSAGGSCPTDCKDTDPCTNDTCDTSTSPPSCRHEPITADVMPDGIAHTIKADALHRVTMTAAGDAFYFAVFETTGPRNDLTLYRLRPNGTAVEELVKTSGIGLLMGRQVRSGVGLVADTSVGLRLHGFVAFADLLPANTSVWHIVLDGSFDPRNGTYTQVGAGYDATDPHRYPVALKVGNTVRGAWITTDGQITSAAAGISPTVLGDTVLRAQQLAPIASQDTFGVAYALSDATGANQGIYTQLVGSAKSQLTACQLTKGIYLSMSSVSMGLAGFQLVNWTKAGEGFLTTENKGIGCSGLICGGRNMCEADQDEQWERNPAIATLTRSGDPVGTIFQAGALPFLDVSKLEGVLALIAVRIDLGAVPFQQPPVATPIATKELSRITVSPPGYEGPDWPAISMLEPNKIALAWIEPNASGGDDLHVRRYAFCLAR
jgi:hypothetical protein